MVEPELTLDEIREDLHYILEYLRESRDKKMNERLPGGRELSTAITYIETGCMWMNRSDFAENDYSPIINED